jgi:4-hydroxy-3-polyprenylbenzoate decarboxylase
MFYASAERFAYNGSEYDIAGWLKGEPFEVIMGKYTNIPIPAWAEIAIEGEILPNELVVEGPFGEWTGYGEARKSWVIRVKRVLYRNNPILTVQSPTAPTRPPDRLIADPRISGVLWDQMEKTGVRGITGVAVYVGRLLTVVSIRNLYAGHVRQVGHTATHCHASAYLGRHVIVVDEEIDPYNIDQVMWAVAKWSDPERAIDIVRYCWSDRLDCGLFYDESKSDIPDAPVYNSRSVIDACRPYEWDPAYKENVLYPQELLEQIKRKWGDILFGPSKKPGEKAWYH